jgi:hypothetical protein
MPGMTDQLQHNLILTRFRATLDEIHGPRIERVILYGSRARRCAGGFRL